MNTMTLRRLFWKEWCENWTTAIWFSLILGLSMIAVVLSHSMEKPDDTPLLLFWIWGFAGVFAASGLISREVGNGTLDFLMSLPVSRKQVWIVKILAGASITLATVAGSTLVWVPVQRLLFGSSAFDQSVLDRFGEIGWFMGAIAIVFSISLLISSFVDRSLSAAMMSLITCLVLAIGESMLFQKWHVRLHQEEGCNMVLIGLFCIPAILWAAFWAFTHGESMRTPVRFKWAAIGLAAGLACVLVVGVVLEPMWTHFHTSAGF